MSMQTLYDAYYRLVQDSVIQKKARSFHYRQLCYKNMTENENASASASETSLLRRSTRIKELDNHLSLFTNI